MRFSCTKVCMIARPSPSPPKIAESGTRTSVRVTSPWSLGMLNVHQKNGTSNPGESVGTMNAVMPRASPGLPEVRAKTTSWVAEWTPVFHRFVPLITHPPSRRTAVVSIHVASLPWSGSVSPNARRRSPRIDGSTNSSRCSGVPNRCSRCTKTRLPTTLCSFCRSLCSPSPRCARCSRITAMSRLDPALPPSSAGRWYRNQPAASARRRTSARSSSHSLRGTPPFSTSVRANSRRWSKNRMLSSCSCSGVISASMNASSWPSRVVRAGGKAKSTLTSSLSSGGPTGAR